MRYIASAENFDFVQDRPFSHILSHIIIIINLLYACAERLRYLLCVCVCTNIFEV